MSTQLSLQNHLSTLPSGARSSFLKMINQRQSQGQGQDQDQKERVNWNLQNLPQDPSDPLEFPPKKWVNITHPIVDPHPSPEPSYYSGQISSILQDPTNPDIVYLGGVGGVFKTTNFSDEFPDWTALTDEILLSGTGGGGGGIAGMAFGKKSNILYIVSNFRVNSASYVYKSMDGGQTWKQGKGFPVWVEVYNLLVIPDQNPNQDLVFIGTSDSLYRSDDGGKNFSRLDQGFTLASDVQFPSLVTSSQNLGYYPLIEPYANTSQGLPLYSSPIPRIRALTQTLQNGIPTLIANACYGQPMFDENHRPVPLSGSSSRNVDDFNILLSAPLPGTDWTRLNLPLNDLMYSDPVPYTATLVDPYSSGQKFLHVKDSSASFKVGDAVYAPVNPSDVNAGLFPPGTHFILGRITKIEDNGDQTYNLYVNYNMKGTVSSYWDGIILKDSLIRLYHLPEQRVTVFQSNQEKIYGLCGGILTSDPNNGLESIGVANTGSFSPPRGIIVSENGGLSWSFIDFSVELGIFSFFGQDFFFNMLFYIQDGGQYDYSNTLLVDFDPENGDTLYFSDFITAKKNLKTDKYWSVSLPVFAPPFQDGNTWIHVDFHASALVWIKGNKHVAFGNDGGLIVTGLNNPNAKTKKILNLQVDGVSSSPSLESTLGNLIALQDNSTQYIANALDGNLLYNDIFGGDGTSCLLSQDRHKPYAFATVQYNIIGGITNYKALDHLSLLPNYLLSGPQLSDIIGRYSNRFPYLIDVPSDKCDKYATLYTHDANTIEKWKYDVTNMGTIDTPSAPVLKKAEVVSTNIRATLVPEINSTVPYLGLFSTYATYGSDTDRGRLFDLSIPVEGCMAFVDGNNVLWLSHNDGKKWHFSTALRDIHTSNPLFDLYKTVLLYKKDTVLVGNKNPYNETGTNTILKSTNKGQTFVDVSKGLPPYTYINQIINYPCNHKIIFAATNQGVYMSKNCGNSWKLFGKGLPISTPSSNIYIYPDGKYMLVGTQGRGIWAINLNKNGK